MYCIDKVNYLADISVGDNYADSNADVRGSSSVILRTKTAVEIWERYKESFVYELENEENIFRAQKLGDRERNLIYAMYKGISYKLPENFVFENRKHYGKSSYRKALQKVANGKCRDYRYIYRKSRHNSKKILTLFCGLFGRVKKAGMVCTKRR